MSTSSVLVLRAIVAAAGEVGAGSRLCEALELRPGALDDLEQRVPFALIVRAWELAPRLTGDDCFGLHLAERSAVGSFGVLDYAARTCATVGDAFERLCRWQRLLHDAVHVTVEVRDDAVRILHRMHGVRSPGLRQASEAALALYVLRARAFAGRPLAPRRVGFGHRAPPDCAEHQRIFAAPIEFDSEGDELLFDRAVVDVPIRGADDGLRRVLDHHAIDLLSRLPSSESRVAAVTRLVADALPDGPPSLATIARQLGTSVRTLQRQLGAEGTSLSAVVEAVRHDLALRYVRDPAVSLLDIAFLLGYSEQSAFHRAFRRWAGTTPQTYRRTAALDPKKDGPA